jgi:DNA polymerase elongation subunit (family B)
MEDQKKPITKKIKRVVNGKSFRLIDFNTYDMSDSFSKETSESGSNDDDSVQRSKWKPKEAPKFIIQMFGLNEKGETCCIYVDDFSPFFFVRVPTSWVKKDATEFLRFLKEKVGKFHAPSIMSIDILDANKLYGFTAGKTDKFIKLTFKNTSAFNKVKNLWFVSEDGDYKNRKLVPLVYKDQTLDLYESFLPPLLRYFHLNDVSPSGWVFVKTELARDPEKKTTTCTYEYICKASDIKSQPEKMTRVPYKICSFDIEASSSHGDFPLPKKTYKRLATQLVDVFLNMCSPPNPPMDKTRSNLLLKKVILTAFGLDKFEDIDLVYPKQIPTKEKVLKLIDILQKTQLKNVKMMNEEEDNSHLLEIDRAFEKIKESANTEGIEGVEGQELPSEFAVTEEPKSFDFWNKPKALTKSDLSNTLVDILTNDKITRDIKIDTANDSLTMLFPRLEGDKVTFIGSTFLRYGEPEPYLNHCVVLGTCDPVENAEIVSVSSELDLLLQWKDLIQKENPDIMIGYNIFGFDYEFLFRRAEENNCEREFLKLSRKEGEVCAKPVKQEGMFMADEDTCELNIENPAPIKLATGEYHLKFVKMTGRLQIDMFVYFRRTFNLPSYKLDDVAGQNISDDIKRIEHILRRGTQVIRNPSDFQTPATPSSHSDMKKIYDLKTQNYDVECDMVPVTELFTSNIKGLHIGDFIHIEISGFTSDYYKNGHKFKVLDIDRGRDQIEMVKGEQKTIKYNVITISGHEQIDMTKHIKWGMAKDDMSPADIFRLADGSASDRAIVAKYCIQDCNLVHHLMNKIDLITGYIEMSTICSVPINYLVFRGQSIKLTSFLAKKCREKNTLMPDLQKSVDKEGYEGAIVLPPKCSMYMDNPVACVDYSSLYPSSMISQNFSHDSKVWVKEYDLTGDLVKETGEKDATGKFKYDNLPGYKYIDIEFDNFKWLRDPAKPRSKEVKTKVGKFIVRWAQLPQGEKSILPAILEQLLGARAATRKKIKTEPDPFMQNILEKRQIGYKETANSLYGACGASVSPFYEKDVAACTTATGRMMIMYAKRIIEEVYGDLEYDTEIHGPVKCKAEYVYGDSVASYTPVYIKVNGLFEIVTIEQLAEKHGQNRWVKCVEEGKQEKEFCELTNVETWTEQGWTKLHRVIRHDLASHKKMVRILTHTGLVDVTDDHSLLKPDGEEISPKEVSIGTELLHHSLPTITVSSNIYTVEQARVMGFFFGDGSCGSYNCASGKKHSWALNNASLLLIEQYVDLCKTAYPDLEWRYMDTLESSGVYKISPKCETYGSIAKFVEMYREMMYQDKAKIIPYGILNGSQEVRKAFWDGMYDADGDKDKNGYVRIDQKNQISASHIAWLASSLGWKTSINTRSDKLDIYRITMTTKTQRKNPNAIKKMHDIEYQGFVYDLTTENHHFAAGIGNMIVHNTDSVFFTFNLENAETKEKIIGKKALEMTIEIAQDAAQLCSKYLKPPMELSYEKTLMPFILLSKKRYVGMLYETDANKGKMKFMGLAIKRRDSCDYLKDVYGGILNILMGINQKTQVEVSDRVQIAIDYLNHALETLISGKVSMDKLTMTRQLKSEYKNPDQIAHNVLANRIAKRDPGNKPKSGDRMKYLVVCQGSTKDKLGERIETPEYTIEKKIPIDYLYYIENQLMEPLKQLFGLALERIWELQGKTSALKTFKKDITAFEEEFPDLETFMKKREKHCSKKIEELLFKKFLTKIDNEKKKLQTINTFFVKK